MKNINEEPEIITDEYIINCFYKNKRYTFEQNKDKYFTNKVKEYLENRFKYSESIFETIYCIKHNIDRDNKICPICHKGILKFTGNKSRGAFQRGCCSECQLKYRNINSKNTCLKRYGVTSVLKLKSFQEKSKQTCLKKYGVEYSLQSNIVKEKSKQTNLKRYGTEYTFQSPIIKDKMKQTCLKRYGVEYANQSEIIKDKIKKTNLERYGAENVYGSDYFKKGYYILKSQNNNKNLFNTNHFKQIVKIKQKEIQEKRDNTKRKNHTFNTSKPEDNCYNILINKYSVDDIERQYKSDLYPYQCDFYIKSSNTYIECNFHWTHCGHKFDYNNKDDVNKLEQMKEKAKTSKFYKNAIKVWTERDVNKFEYAKKNNLNYLVFYNIKEFEDYFNN